jgi:hypothetical protein
MEIIRKIYLRSIKINILIILLFTAMIVAVNIEFTNLVRAYSYETQITDFPKDYYYLSISDSILNNIKSNQELINNVLNTGEVETVGNYELQDGQLDNNTCKIYELNSVMQKIKYQLSDGSWFTDENDCQLILGGNIAQKYNIGDWVNVSDENGQNYKGRVIGKLKNPAYLMHLNYAQYEQAGALSYEQILYSYYDDICLTNQYDGNLSDLNIKCAWIFSLFYKSGSLFNVIFSFTIFTRISRFFASMFQFQGKGTRLCYSQFLMKMHSHKYSNNGRDNIRNRLSIKNAAYTPNHREN